jgi:ABC-type multidrug transport system permease subunit
VLFKKNSVIQLSNIAKTVINKSMLTINKKNMYTALLVAVIVGTMLNVINSYDVFWERKFTARNIIRIVLTYVTPFCVSLYSSTKALK